MIRKIGIKLREMRFQYNRAKEQKLLDNFVTIHADRINKPAYDEIKNAQKVMVNYVMNKGVGVDIYDAQEAVALGFATKPHKNETLANKLLVKVTNLLNGIVDEKLVSADTKAIHHNTREGFVVFDIPADGVQYSRKTKKSYEDTFLKNLYCNIQEMTEKITK